MLVSNRNTNVFSGFQRRQHGVVFFSGRWPQRLTKNAMTENHREPPTAAESLKENPKRGYTGTFSDTSRRSDATHDPLGLTKTFVQYS